MDFCLRCGKEMEDDMKYCPVCGEPCIGSSKSTVTQGEVEQIEKLELKNTQIVSPETKKLKKRKIIAVLCIAIFILGFGIARWNYTNESSWVWAEYALEGKYSYLQGKITVLADCYNVAGFDSTLQIVGDGVVLFSTRLTPEMGVQTINVDITGVDSLRIYVFDNISSEGGTAFGLLDFLVGKI